MRIPLPDGLRLRVRDRGRGPPVLLVHGFTGSVEAWGEEILDGLRSAGHRVLAVDLPGHGRSDAPPDPGRYALHRVVADLAAVLELFELPSADWIGYSMGGRIALGAAVLRPDAVRRLVLEGASPGISDEAEAAARREEDETRARRILSGSMEEFVDAWLAHPLFATRRRLPEEVRRRERERRLSCDPEGLANTLRGLGTGCQPSFWEGLEGIRAPTMVLTGSEDPKFENIARSMTPRIPGAVHRSVDGAGHTVHLERPGAWLDEVTRFLAETTEEEREA